jgi:hypothetical protein
MSLFSSIGKRLIRPATKGLKAGVPKLIKGVKSSGQVLTKGLKRTIVGAKNVGKSLITRAKALLGMPQGIIKETVIKRGTRPLAKISGKFDESLLKNMKPIKEIAKQPFVKQTLTKAQRLKNAKAAIKSGKQIKNLF